MKLIIAAAVLGVAFASSIISNKIDKALAAADSIQFMCNNATNDQLGQPQSLGRCYGRYFVCMEEDGRRTWETINCDECMRFDEDLLECRPQSQIAKCQTDADGYDILDIDDVLLACDRLHFDEPILAVNPKKACSNVYMQCAINSMGIEGDFRYDVIAGGILYCDDKTLAFDNKTQKCQDRALVDDCLISKLRSPRQTNESVSETTGNSTHPTNQTVLPVATNATILLANATVKSVSSDNATVEMRPNLESNESVEFNKTGSFKNSTESSLNATTIASGVQPINTTTTMATIVRRRRQAELNSTAVLNDTASLNLTTELGNSTTPKNITTSPKNLTAAIVLTRPKRDVNVVNYTTENSTEVLNRTAEEQIESTTPQSNLTLNSTIDELENSTSKNLTTTTVQPISSSASVLVRRRRQIDTPMLNITSDVANATQNATVETTTISSENATVENGTFGEWNTTISMVNSTELLMNTTTTVQSTTPAVLVRRKRQALDALMPDEMVVESTINSTDVEPKHNATLNETIVSVNDTMPTTSTVASANSTLNVTVAPENTTVIARRRRSTQPEIFEEDYDFSTAPTVTTEEPVELIVRRKRQAENSTFALPTVMPEVNSTLGAETTTTILNTTTVRGHRYVNKTLEEANQPSATLLLPTSAKEQKAIEEKAE